MAARLAVAGLLALTLLEALWELVLAPLPGGRWLAVKALPLALLIPGVAAGRTRSRQWLVLLVPWYAAEGVVRALTEPGRHSVVAATVTGVAVATFLAAFVWLRADKRAGRFR